METAHRNDEAKVFRTIIIIYSLFKSEHSNTNIKLTLHKPLIGVSNDLCLSHLGISGRHLPLKIEALANYGSPQVGHFARCTPVRDLHTAFNLPYVYDYIMKVCRQLAEVIQSHENEHVRSRGRDETRHRKHKSLKFGGGEAYDRSSD
jgi:hypothetical protein